MLNAVVFNDTGRYHNELPTTMGTLHEGPPTREGKRESVGADLSSFSRRRKAESRPAFVGRELQGGGPIDSPARCGLFRPLIGCEREEAEIGTTMTSVRAMTVPKSAPRSVISAEGQ